MVRLCPSTKVLAWSGILGCLFVVLAWACAPPLAAAAEPPSSEPILAYSLDEGAGATAADLYGGHEATVAGARWAEGKYGTALRFSGRATECLQTPEAADLQLAGAFTIEAWIRPEGPEALREPIIFKEGSGDGVAGYGVYLGLVYKGRLDGFIGKTARRPYSVEDPAALPVRRWSHVAVTFDGAKLRLYVDGGLVGEAASAAVKPTTGPLSIGCDKEFGEHFNGKIDEVRIYDRALSPAEIEADRDTAILTPPTSEPVAGWLLDEGQGTTATDHFRGHVGTVENATWTEGKYGAALQFDGTNSCVTVPFAPDLELTEDFTLEAWVRPEGGLGEQPIVTMEDPLPVENQEPFLFSLLAADGGGLPAGQVREGGKPGYWEASGEERLPQNAWSHLTLTDDGTTLRLYVGGELRGTAPAPSMRPESGPLRIGCETAFGNYFKGRIDNVLLYNRALSVAQIEADERNDFTPPVIELTGPLTEGLKEGTTEYPLHVHATDGGPGRPGVGVKSITISVDGNVVDQVEQGCPEGSCPMETTWTFDPAAYGPAPYLVTVQSEDIAGNVSSQNLELAQPDGSIPACDPLDPSDINSIPDETKALPGGGTLAVYHADEGLEYEFPEPPANFDPTKASGEELEAYGYPERPSEPAARAEWEAEMSSIKGSSPPMACSGYPNEPQAETSFLNGSTLLSPIWSGYLAYDKAREDIWNGGKGTFTAANPEKNSPVCPASAVTEWVGLGGLEEEAGEPEPLLQAGFVYGRGNSFETYTETSPRSGLAPSVPVDFAIKPGNRVQVEVRYSEAAERVVYWFNNKSSGRARAVRVSHLPPGQFYDGSTVDFIDERPSFKKKPAEFANFGQDQWGGVSVRRKEGGEWSVLGHNPRLRDEAGQLNGEGNTMASPSGLGPANDGFRNVWHACHP